MRQAVLTGLNRFEICETDIPQIGHQDVLIRVSTCGICTGELHVWNDSHVTDYPKYLGHEVVGQIVEVGSDVTNVRVGDIVSAINQHSGFADFCKTPAESVVSVPENVPTKIAIGEPLACAVNAMRRIMPRNGSTIVIVGCGFMGLLLLQCLKAQSSARIIAIDIREESLEWAKKLGADTIIHATRENAVETIDGITAGQGADVVIEATGTQSGLDLSTELVKIRGLLVVYGYHQGGMRQVNMQLWNWKGLDVINAHERDVSVYVEGMKIGLNLVSMGKVELASLITHRFQLEEINKAFTTGINKAEGYVKGTIDLVWS